MTKLLPVNDENSNEDVKIKRGTDLRQIFKQRITRSLENLDNINEKKVESSIDELRNKSVLSSQEDLTQVEKKLELLLNDIIESPKLKNKTEKFSLSSENLGASLSVSICNFTADSLDTDNDLDEVSLSNLYFSYNNHALNSLKLF